jgi:hypothetical protein
MMQISKIKNKNKEVTTNTKEIQGIIKDYFWGYKFQYIENSWRNGHIYRYLTIQN